MATVAADSAFVRRLAAAARAAWWTFLIGAGVAVVQFLVYSAVSHCEASWSGMASFMQADPQELRLLMFRFMLAIRLVLVILAIGAIFLSLWAHRLRRVGDAG
jgi:heme/copper-type cytochrome/quinol oxidase subunit 2